MTTRAHGGLGLGLAIVRHLVELHGGSVDVDSPGMGQGATFTVALPIMIVHNEQSRESLRHSMAGNAASILDPPGLDDLHVLVVDDESDAREMVTTILEQYGAKVTAVASSVEALAALERITPDVLLCDIGMPEEDGYTLIGKIRALPAERGGRVPAAALTAYAGSEDRKRALLSGFQVHFPKPIDSTELAAVVASLAGRIGTHK